MDHQATAGFNSPRLVRLLSRHLSPRTEAPQPTSFSERFGQLMDFSGSVALSVVHEELRESLFEPNRASIQEIRNEFIKNRMAVLRFIAVSFIPRSNRTRRKLPSSGEFHAHLKRIGLYDEAVMSKVSMQAAAFEPYREFYIMLQREIAIKTAGLRARARDALAGLSLELKQLSVLDKTIENALAARTRTLFALIPGIMGRDFGQLFFKHWQLLPQKPTADDIEQWTRPHGWISNFCLEMRDILFAELEVRLLPVIGMIDMLPESPAMIR